MKNLRKLVTALKNVVAQYAYTKAGDGAQPGVKEAIKEFKALPEEEKSTTPLLYWLLGTGTPEYKMSKNDSEYVAETEIDIQTCDNCEYAFTKTITEPSGDPDIICSQITGRVHAKGWCRLWEKGVLGKRHPY